MSYELIVTPDFTNVLFKMSSPIVEAITNIAAYPTMSAFDAPYLFLKAGAEGNRNNVTLPIFFDPTNTKFDINFIDIKSDMCTVSYLPKAKMIELFTAQTVRTTAISCSRYSNYQSLIELMYSRLRMSARPAKVVNKLFGNKFTEKQYAIFGEEFGNAWQQWKDASNNIHIVSGEDIRKYYHVDSYYTTSGTLSDSCMRYSSCQQYLDIYVKNPNQIKLIVQLIDGKVAARCLLWDNKYYDRIYYSDNISQNAMVAFCNKNKFVSIYRNDAPFSIQLDKWDFEHFPYMDSLKFLSKTGVLTNQTRNMKLETTNGCYIEYFVCKYCKEKFHYLQRRGVYIDESTDDVCCGNCSVASSYIGKFILLKDAVYSPHNDTYLLKRDAVTLNGAVYHKNQVHTCTHCNEQFLKARINQSTVCNKCQLAQSKEINNVVLPLRYSARDSKYYTYGDTYDTFGYVDTDYTTIDFASLLRNEARNIIVRYDNT